MPHFVLLPGLDGTGRLFRPFLAEAPSHGTCRAVALPAARLTYRELVTTVAPDVPDGAVLPTAETMRAAHCCYTPARWRAPWLDGAR